MSCQCFDTVSKSRHISSHGPVKWQQSRAKNVFFGSLGLVAKITQEEEEQAVSCWQTVRQTVSFVTTCILFQVEEFFGISSTRMNVWCPFRHFLLALIRGSLQESKTRFKIVKMALRGALNPDLLAFQSSMRPHIEFNATSTQHVAGHDVTVDFFCEIELPANELKSTVV